MFTTNWYKMLFSQMVGKGASYSAVDGGTQTVGYGSATHYIPLIGTNDAGYFPSMQKLRTSYATHGGVVLGTGTTPPSKDDYCLSGTVISGFTHSTNFTTSVDGAGATLTAVYTITNTTDSPFTIGELGLICNIKSVSSSGATSASNKALLEHTVLDSPLTIQGGGVGVLTYTIRLNFTS